MKHVFRKLTKDREGAIGLIPVEGDDMWHAYNLICEGDLLEASTFRKVQQESCTGSVSSSKVRTTVTIKVESTDFDIGACLLKVSGRNVKENKYMKMGSYHTVDLEPNRKFTLHKAYWYSIHLERIDVACNPEKHADLAAVIMQEGLAHVCFITSAMTVCKAKIDVSVPKKSKYDSGHRNDALSTFFSQIYDAMIGQISFDVVKAVIIASPGFYKDDFFEYLIKRATKNEEKPFLENRHKFVLAHSSSGFKHALKDVLENPAIASKLTDTKAADEVRALQQFMELLGTDPDRAYYGYKHVERANRALAIQTLLISDSLFRSKKLAERELYVAFVDAARDNGADVKIFSSLHVSGQELDQMTGIAAILRFPMPEIEEGDHGAD